MVERVQVQRGDEPEPAGDEAHPLRAALTQAAGASLITRRQLSRRINELLLAMGPGPQAKADARLLIELLEGDELGELADEKGRSCRVEAIDALLRLGYPWALEVHPGDLEFFRGQTHRRPRWVKIVLVAAIAAALGLGATTWLLAQPVHAPPIVAPIPRPEHLALAHPEQAPRELLVANTSTTCVARRFTRDPRAEFEYDTPIAQISIRSLSGPGHGLQLGDQFAFKPDPPTSPQVKVRALGLYDEVTGELVQSFPAETMKGLDRAGESSLYITIPLAEPLVTSGGRYFFVLDTSVNGTPYRAMRTDLLRAASSTESGEVEVLFSSAPTLTTPLGVATRRGDVPTRLLVTVDSTGQVEQAIGLSGPDREYIEQVRAAVLTARFEPARRPGLGGRPPVGASFVFEYPVPVDEWPAHQR